MSLSPSASNDSETTSKRRRTDSGAGMPLEHRAAGISVHNQSQPPAHIPKRGARACTACRKGKNRCEGEVRIYKRIPSRATDVWPASPSGPAFFIYFRLLAVGVHITEYLAFTRNQREKMYRAWPGRVLSKYRCGTSSFHFIVLLTDVRQLKTSFSSRRTVFGKSFASSLS
jgi:hypothetical protein